jgi:pimeloyl-ACP methyl ester carboxylesterase
MGPPVDLVGHSRGGLVALQVARASPELLRRLVIAEPPPVSLIPADETLDPTRPHTAAIVDQRFAAGDIEGGIAAYADWNAEQEGAWKRLPDPFKNAIRGNAWTVPVAAREVFPRLNCGSLASVRMPVLLVNGGRTQARHVKTSEALKKCLPHAERMTVPNAGHAMHLENAADFNAGVERFLSQ